MDAVELNMLMCDICGAGFYKQHNLEAHQARHVDDGGNFSEKIIVRSFVCGRAKAMKNYIEDLDEDDAELLDILNAAQQKLDLKRTKQSPNKKATSDQSIELSQ